jgi:hypothetical protein
LQLVADQTGRAGEIIYIGHSMGTTLGFMHASENPGKKQGLIKGLIALAPIVYLDGITVLELATPIGIPLLVSTNITAAKYFATCFCQDILGVLQIKGLLYQEELIHRFLTGFCKTVSPGVCFLLINVAFGKTVQFQAVSCSYFSFHKNRSCISGRFAAVLQLLAKRYIHLPTETIFTNSQKQKISKI